MQYPDLDTPVSPLRQRLIDDMNMRRFSREPQRNYLRDIDAWRLSSGGRPDTATADGLRDDYRQAFTVPSTTRTAANSLSQSAHGHTRDCVGSFVCWFAPET